MSLEESEYDPTVMLAGSDDGEGEASEAKDLLSEDASTVFSDQLDGVKIEDFAIKDEEALLAEARVSAGGEKSSAPKTTPVTTPEKTKTVDQVVTPLKPVDGNKLSVSDFEQTKRDLVNMMKKTLEEEINLVSDYDSRIKTLTTSRDEAKKTNQSKKVASLNQELQQVRNDSEFSRSRVRLYTVLVERGAAWKSEADFVSDFFCHGGYTQIIETVRSIEAHIKDVETNIMKTVTSCKGALNKIETEQQLMKNQLTSLTSVIETLKPILDARRGVKLLLQHARYTKDGLPTLTALPESVIERLMTYASPDEILGCFPHTSVNDTQREQLGLQLMSLAKECKRRAESQPKN